MLVLIATLVASIAGGKVGERYHRKVDRVGFEGRAATAGERAAEPDGRDEYERDGDRERYRTA